MNNLQTILGANGTIGSLLPLELIQYTQHIRLVSRNPRKVNSTDELFPADLMDITQVEKAIEGSSIVYLLVGFEYNVKVWRECWPKLMRATLDACIKNKCKLVFFDNVYMYDTAAIPQMMEDSPLHPSSQKGLVRKQISDMLMAEVKAGRLDALIARSADFYGPKNEKSMLTELVFNNLKKGKKANWVMDADKKHSFTYTPDAAKATALLGNSTDTYNQVWHLPTDPKTLTGREIADEFSQAMNGKKGITVLPLWLMKILGIFIPIMKEFPEMMYQYDREYFFDSTKFAKRFDFKTTTYREGIRQQVLLSKN